MAHTQFFIMGNKRLHTSVRLDRDDLDFLRQCNVFKDDSEGVRFAIKFLRLYGLPAIRDINTKVK
jgi:hypothetical protein